MCGKCVYKVSTLYFLEPLGTIMHAFYLSFYNITQKWTGLHCSWLEAKYHADATGYSVHFYEKLTVYEDLILRRDQCTKCRFLMTYVRDTEGSYMPDL